MTFQIPKNKAETHEVVRDALIAVGFVDYEIASFVETLLLSVGITPGIVENQSELFIQVTEPCLREDRCLEIKVNDVCKCEQFLIADKTMSVLMDLSRE